MAVFAALYEFVDDPEAFNAVRPAHQEFLMAGRGSCRVLGGGRWVDAGPDGALVVVSGDSLEEVASFLDDDPFEAAGLVTARQIRAWSIRVGPWMTSSPDVSNL